MRFWLFTLIYILNLQASNLEELINTAINRHPSLETIKARLSAADYALLRSKNFDNPILKFSINDLQLKDFTNRSLEPMQTESITLSQKISWFGKTEAKVEIEKAKKRELHYSLQEATAELVSKIKITAYKLWEIQELIKVTKEVIDITEQNIELHEAYTASSESGDNHMGIMSAKLLKAKLKIVLSRLLAKEKELTALLGYLSFQKIENLKVQLPKPTLLPFNLLKKEIDNSFVLKIKESNSKIAKEKLKLAKLNITSDPILSIGYSHRQKFEDFFLVGVSFALPIYGTEKIKVQEQRALQLSHKLAVTDTKQRLIANLKKLIAQAKKELEILHIVKDETLPLIDHMFDLAKTHIAAGGDFFKFMDIVEKKLNLEAQAILARANFHITKAKIDSLLGKIYKPKF